MLPWMLGCGWLATVDEPRLVRLEGIDVPEVEHAGEVELESFRLAEWDVDDGSCEELVDGPFAIVEVSGSSLTFAGKRLNVPVHDGLIGEADRRGRLIARLYSDMLAAADMSKQMGHMGCLGHGSYTFRGRLLLSMDPGVPAATVDQVVFTALQAQYGAVFLLVDDPTPVATLPEPGTVDEKDSIRIELDPSGAALWSPDRETEALAHGDIADALEKETWQAVVWTARPEMSFGQVVSIIDGSIGDQPPPMSWGAQDGESSAGTVGAVGAPQWLDPTTKVPVLSMATFAKPSPQPAPRPFPAVPPADVTPLRPTPHTTGDVDTVIRRHHNQIRYCFQREQVKAPELVGEVDVTFEIAATGAVESAKAVSDLPEAVSRCIEGRFLRMQFPQGDAGVHEEQFVFGG